MTIRSISVPLLVAVCLCAVGDEALGGLKRTDGVSKLPPARALAPEGLVINKISGRYVPISEIGFDTPAGPGPGRKPTPSAVPAVAGTGVVRVLPIGDSISSGATIFADRARESYRPFLWQDIHVSGPALITSGTVAVDFRGEFSQSGVPFWGDIGTGTDNLTGPNPVLDPGNVPFMGPGNPFGIPAFDDDNQAGRGLDSGSFVRCGPGHPTTPDCNGAAGIQGFDQTDVPSQGNAAKWVADQTPDVATIMLGTNDIGNAEFFSGDFPLASAAVVADKIVEIIDELEKANPDVSVFVSQVPTMWIECALGETFCDVAVEGTGNWVPRFGDDDAALGDHNEVQWVNDAINDAINALDATYDVTLVDIIDSYATDASTQWNPNHAQTWMLASDGGLHPSTLGDDFIASQFFMSMEATLAVKAAQAVPEPSSFLFLGLLGIVAGGWKYSRKHWAAADCPN